MPHRPRLHGPLSAPLLALFLLSACNSTSWPDRDPTLLENPDADTAIFWPPRAYALAGDFLTVEVRGLEHVYACSRVLLLEWTTVDSTAGRYLRPHARVELPAHPSCAISPGLDTMLETTAPAAGQKLYLQTPLGRVTDSLLVVAGTGVVEAFLRARNRANPADSLVTFGRFVFRDSTPGHPKRTLRSDSLESCEILQAAVYRRLHGGDTLTISLRTLLNASFPSCTGLYADTVEVVLDKYGFP
jgi:hypothetical protein